MPRPSSARSDIVPEALVGVQVFPFISHTVLRRPYYSLELKPLKRYVSSAVKGRLQEGSIACYLRYLDLSLCVDTARGEVPGRQGYPTDLIRNALQTLAALSVALQSLYLGFFGSDSIFDSDTTPDAEPCLTLKAWFPQLVVLSMNATRMQNREHSERDLDHAALSFRTLHFSYDPDIDNTWSTIDDRRRLLPPKDFKRAAFVHQQ